MTENNVPDHADGPGSDGDNEVFSGYKTMKEFTQVRIEATSEFTYSSLFS